LPEIWEKTFTVAIGLREPVELTVLAIEPRRRDWNS
jgi:hypothetical protein